MDGELDYLNRIIDRIYGEYDHTKRTIADERDASIRAAADLETAIAARDIAQTVAASVQQLAHEQMSRVVDRCLKTVFGPDAYDFNIQFERKRGKTEATLQFIRGGVVVDPTTAAGGGVVDVGAFALRLAALLLSVPKRRRVLFLDEPFKHLSANYRPAIRELITILSRELGVQIVMITHDPQLVTGTVIRLGDSES